MYKCSRCNGRLMFDSEWFCLNCGYRPSKRFSVRQAETMLLSEKLDQRRRRFPDSIGEKLELVLTK